MISILTVLFPRKRQFSTFIFLDLVIIASAKKVFNAYKSIPQKDIIPLQALKWRGFGYFYLFVHQYTLLIQNLGPACAVIWLSFQFIRFHFHSETSKSKSLLKSGSCRLCGASLASWVAVPCLVPNL